MYNFKEEYKKQLKILQEQVKSCQNKLDVLMQQLLQIQDQNSHEANYLKKCIFENWYFIYIANYEIEFLRPSSIADFDYRMDIYNNFARIVQEDLPNNIPFRFHGTSIYFAKEIIETSEISCSQDRLGFTTSHDLDGYFSVTTKDSIGITIHNYINLTDFCMPAGCIFVLLPKKDHRKLKGDQMKKVNFQNDPNILIAIITTLENIPMVKQWCIKNNIDENKVCDFWNFLNYAKESITYYKKKQ